MTAAKRLGLILAIFLALPCFLVFHMMTHHLADFYLHPFANRLAAMPNFVEIMGQMGWLAVECVPLLVWRSWRDIGSLRLRPSWTVLVPTLAGFINLSGFKGLPAAHPWVGTLDVLWHTLLIAANEEIICRGYMFHNRPRLHPRVTVLASSLAFALIHYLNLDQHHDFQGVTHQVIFAFFMGIGLGTVRLATGSLGWCVLIHWFVDAAFDLDGRTDEFRRLADLVLPPLWLTLTVVVFCVHPALRAVPAPAAFLPPPSSPRRWRIVRWTVVTLLGLVGGLAFLLAACAPFVVRPYTRHDLETTVGLLGKVAVPCGLFAGMVAGWHRWQRQRVLVPPPADPPLAEISPAQQTVKVGGTISFYLSLLALLGMALIPSLPNFTFSPLMALASWKNAWDHRFWLGVTVFGGLVLPALTAGSLWLACRPRSSQRTTVWWMFAAACYGYMVWLDVRHLHLKFTWTHDLLKLHLWNIGAAGLLTVALLITLTTLRQRRAFQTAPGGPTLPEPAGLDISPIPPSVAPDH